MKESKQLKSKDKLFLIVHLAVESELKSQQNFQVAQMTSYINSLVDDSVVVLVLPKISGSETTVEPFSANPNSRKIKKSFSNLVTRVQAESNKLIQNNI